MTKELFLRRKWTFRAYGKQVVFVKKPRESTHHVLMKALLWALYLPQYPEISVEIHIGDRYKPDLVQLDGNGRPTFWAEAGKVSPQKIRSLLKRYPTTHFVIAKWDTPLEPYVELVRQAATSLKQSGRCELINFPADSAERFIDQRGQVRVSPQEITVVKVL